MQQWHRTFAIAGVAAVLAGCGDMLEVTNPNAPDRIRALATPQAVERLIKDAYVGVNEATLGRFFLAGFGVNDGLQPQLLVLGAENFGVNANFGMNLRGILPRQGIDNNRGNSVEGGNFRDFNGLHRAARAAAIGSNATEAEGFTLGSEGALVRARAFALFVQGVAMGYLSLAYDSAAIIDKDDQIDASPPVIPDIVGYQELNQAALQYIEDAITLSTSDPSAFPLPQDWLHTGATVSHADFVRIARTYQVRFRANVARTPAERLQVDWGRVVSDAQAALPTDLVMDMSVAGGRNVAWPIQHFVGPQWHMMHQFMIFFADTTGTFEDWLAAPSGRTLIRTPDNRFPAGNTRAAQQTNCAQFAPPPNATQCLVALPPGRYIRNRTAQDAPAPSYAESMYDHIRFAAFPPNYAGPWPIVTRAEIDLLQAEGHYRLGEFQEAINLINPYRTAANLPAITSTDPTAPVPGGSACVPRVPNASATSTSCGDLLEALKWEYRMETAYTGYGNWYFPSRGWGDLPEGTPLHFPVPYQEMDARVAPFRTFLGGVGGIDAAGASTYGMERLATR